MKRIKDKWGVGGGAPQWRGDFFRDLRLMRKEVYGVILAGGKSSRYHRLHHKYLDIYKGKEIILHVFEAISPVVDRVILVVGKDNRDVKALFKGKDNILYAVQEEPLGTGHALLSTADYLENRDAIIVVSFADKPLVTTHTFSLLLEKHLQSGAEITFAVAHLPDPGKKGRIIRKNGKFVDIVEYLDADEETRKIKEIHAGYLCCYSRSIFKMLRLLDNQNAQGEYYLTKVYSLFLKNGYKVETVEISPEESYDINTVSQLENLDKWREKIRKLSGR